jgi:hypothetical protein
MIPGKSTAVLFALSNWLSGINHTVLFLVSSFIPEHIRL